ncbi:iron permease [Athelia psychrophila]|uniref:Iron permease n=1 Tax=Athelia psychrophila TaxID=1759441 RepID=A0A165XSX8_9AGAM|nr:iron permease [Fibularhizoctonia sp. CBS 109695]
MAEQTTAVPISIDTAEKEISRKPAIATTEQLGAKRDWHFWGIFLSLAVASLTSALDLSSISTALPVIANDLHGSQFVWVGSAYTLSSTAFLPMSGGLAQAFGRRPVILFSLLVFGIGSAMCGAAPSMNFLIAARTIQGVGGGGILSLTSIIVTDLVPLQERGLYQGLIGISWAVATAVGPLIGGALAERGAWRWLFYLNLFTTAVAAAFMLILLRLKNPPGTIREKLARMDWIGNVLVIAASSSLLIALTWGGVQYPWSSPHVLTPLVLGVVGFGVFVFYEAKYANNPIVPLFILSNRTTASGYLQTFIMAVIMLAISYYLPVYYQACNGASPIATGIDAFGLALTLAPSGIVVGATVAASKRYRPQMWMAWCLLLVGTGLLSILEVDTSRGTSIGIQVISGVGLGLLITTTLFPVLAPLPVSANANAVAFLIFMRSFGQVWGVTIGATILQNQLVKRLPIEFTSTFPQGAEIAYASIDILDKLPQPLQGEVRVAFADALRVIWQVMIGVAGAGLGVSLMMKHVELHNITDQDWDLDEQNAGVDEEKAIPVLETLPAA